MSERGVGRDGKGWEGKGKERKDTDPSISMS